ncbi:MAG: 3,4-dihydroxy-2-butanone-4-phosphate synthase [Actinophytocola sp.]|nr:3,4-dihydroxy-2-butanone-4-phosphate synthase [Actinophytocola sp.]
MSAVLEPPATREPAQVAQAVAEIRAGRMAVLFDEAADEGVLVLAAGMATKRTVAAMIRHTSGLLRAAMPAADLDRLAIPPMVARHDEPGQSRFAVAVDAATGITTGISAGDRALVFRILADPTSVPGDLIRPGHVIPERVAFGGVLERPCRAEGAVELTRWAGVGPVAVIGELTDDVGTVLGWAGSVAFAHEHQVPIVTIADLVSDQSGSGPGVSPLSPTYAPK